MRTRQRFEEDLKDLQVRLLEMGNEAGEMLDRAMVALTQQDVALATEIIAQDDVVDGLNQTIEAQCMGLMALQQPLAHDLRVIGSIFKAITDIERIADHAVDIAKIARHIARETRYQTLIDLEGMASQTRQMYSDALTAFANHDLTLVDRVVAGDDVIDALFHRQRDELNALMQRNPNQVVLASYLLFVIAYLERIADRSVNIVERVHYIETGHLLRPPPA